MKATFTDVREAITEQEQFAERARANQHHLTTHLRKSYDFIVCGSGSSGPVVARRLAENSAVTVLLIEAGGSDDVPNVSLAGQWPSNLGSERDWAFQADANSQLNGRAIPLNAGKILGGGSSINVMIWSRGHAKDWDFFAQEAGDPAWNYESVLSIYRRIEDWHGPADPTRRGSGGPVFVQPAPEPNPIAPALLEGARAAGIPTFESPNGRMLEGNGGCSLIDMRIRDQRRLSVFRSYSYPYMDRSNFSVLPRALVTRIIFEEQRAVGVEVAHDGQLHRFGAELEVVLSMGAIQTPKVLMQSGIGDGEELRRIGIPVVMNLPGVASGLQDHAGPASCMWEYPAPMEPRNNGAEATFFWGSDPKLELPNIQVIQGEIAFASAEASARFQPPADCWVLGPASSGHAAPVVFV